jgi:isoquinoline 1-oxidoreductase beta subunit
MIEPLTRNAFISAVVALTGGLAIGVGFEGCATSSLPAAFVPFPWLEIDATGKVTTYLAKAEVGQGVATGLATLIAEELDLPLEKVDIAFAPTKREYIYPGDSRLNTGGSDSMASSWTLLRTVAATARAMLVSAAADRWHVDPASCRTSEGMVCMRHRRKVQRMRVWSRLQPGCRCHGTSS